jgi:hypothetical protein
MSIQWNQTQTVGKSELGYYRLSERYCAEPTVEEDRWFSEYQTGAHQYDPEGEFSVLRSDGFKSKEEAVAAAEKNAETLARALGLR